MNCADTYNLFFNPGEVTEIRAWGLKGANKAWQGRPWGESVVFGYFDNADDFCAAATALDKAGATGVYFVPNPVKPDLLARCCNRLQAAGRNTPTTADKDIECIRWLLIDLDPKRPKGISSSQDELKMSNEIRRAMADWLQNVMGFSPGIPAISGNGSHLCCRLPDLPNTDETKEILKAALHALGEKFSTDDIEIDLKVFNPARIWKLYGTTARKGDSIPARPHRMAYIHQEYLEPGTTDLAALFEDQPGG